MAGSAVACAARQQGQRGLLAWRQALTEAQLCASAQQQAPGAYAGALLTPPPQQQQQQAAGFRSLPAAALLDRGCRRGSTHFNLWQPQLPCDLQASRLAPQHLQQQQQQWRGYAIGFAHYRPRRKEPMDPRRNLPQRNEQIQAAEVRVLWQDPERPGEVMPLKEAVRLAKAEGLDVIMVTPKADPPVVRITDWSKVLFEAQKREKAAAKQKLAQQRLAEPKEVRIGCQIAEHDLVVKMAQARRFLEEGSLLRLVVLFKGGGQIALGREVALYLIGQLADLCKVKDEKHLARPQRGQWAIMLEPLSEAELKRRAKAAAAAAPAAAAASEAAAEGA